MRVAAVRASDSAEARESGEEQGIEDECGGRRVKVLWSLLGSAGLCWVGTKLAEVSQTGFKDWFE